jgi:hypothetical protein
VNLCRSCGEDFAGVSSFDAHRVGKHSYTYSEGVNMEPIREDGRRCLHRDELEANGYEKNEAGRWFHAANAEQARTSFAKALLA